MDLEFMGSARFFRQCIAHINFVPNVRFRIVLVADLRGSKTVLDAGVGRV
jgi:hypothetical protein